MKHPPIPYELLSEKIEKASGVDLKFGGLLGGQRVYKKVNLVLSGVGMTLNPKP